MESRICSPGPATETLVVELNSFCVSLQDKPYCFVMMLTVVVYVLMGVVI